MKKFKNFLLNRDSAKQDAENLAKRSRLAAPIAIIGLMLIFTMAAAQSANAQYATKADSITPPPVPTVVQVEAGNEVFLVGHAVGTQNYICLPCDSTNPNCSNGVAFSLFTPEATLFDDRGEQIITHFFSPNPSPDPFENGVIRATWVHSRDTSTVWAKAIGIATSDTDPDFVRQGAIPWVLLNVKDVGALAGPTGGDKLTKTTFIQRVNTLGGSAPSTGCATSADIGKKAFVPYRADYVFYRKEAGSN